MLGKKCLEKKVSLNVGRNNVWKIMSKKKKSEKCLEKKSENVWKKDWKMSEKKSQKNVWKEKSEKCRGKESQ